MKTPAKLKCHHDRVVLIEAAIIDLKLPDTTRGVKRADRPFASVIQKCGRYVDTTLKLLMSIENSSEVQCR